MLLKCRPARFIIGTAICPPLRNGSIRCGASFFHPPGGVECQQVMEFIPTLAHGGAAVSPASRQIIAVGDHSNNAVRPGVAAAISAWRGNSLRPGDTSRGQPFIGRVKHPRPVSTDQRMIIRSVVP